MVVLNSKEAVHDLLDKRSSIYSDRSDNLIRHFELGLAHLEAECRPRYVMLNELYVFPPGSRAVKHLLKYLKFNKQERIFLGFQFPRV